MTPYATLAEASTYFSDRYQQTAWNNSEDTIRLRALKTATRLINRLNFAGEKTEADQENVFPRDPDTTVIQDIKDACCEIAYSLLDGRDPNFENENVNVSATEIGGIRTRKDTSVVPVHLINNIPSAIAWTYLKPHLVDPHSLQISRTS